MNQRYAICHKIIQSKGHRLHQPSDEWEINLCRNQEEMKNDKATIKSTKDSLKGRLEEAKYWISEWEDKVEKHIQSE